MPADDYARQLANVFCDEYVGPRARDYAVDALAFVIARVRDEALEEAARAGMDRTCGEACGHSDCDGARMAVRHIRALKSRP